VLVTGQTFTQADINGGLIEFRHDGSEGASAGFAFSLSDGTATINSTFAITVTPVNDAPGTPTDNNAAANTVAENAAAGTLAGLTASAFDPDTAVLVYSLTNDAGGAFQIDPTTGVVSVRDASKLNYEALGPGKSLSVTVQATDGFELATQTFAIAITDVNEAPTALAFSNVRSTLAESTSTAARVKIADITITDDAIGTETITVAGADASLFEIFGGDLYLKAGAKLDFETNRLLDVTVNVDDTTLGSGIELSRALSVAVTDAEETIRGTNGDDRLTGGVGDDRILGLNGQDTMSGGAGNDILQGGGGADRMTGGADADTFVFTSIADSAPNASGFISNNPVFNRTSGAGVRDVITDFTLGEDRIDLSAIDANTKLAGNQAFKFLGTAAFTSAPGGLVYRQFNQTGTANDVTIVYGDVDGDKLADFQIELLGLKTLTAANFIL
jgi:Ca2+-binding RTX toxin-like protein